jgi:hypothetical protein
LQDELRLAKSKGADLDLYAGKLEIAMNENLKLKTSRSPQVNESYNEMEATFLARKYQESQMVETALRNQITLAANEKDADERKVESLARRLKQSDKELKAGP